MTIGIEAAHANKPRRTGVENVCWHLINELKKIIPPSERVILYSNTPLAGELAAVPANWSVRVLRWPLKKMWSQTRLAWEMAVKAPDVFFAPGQLVPWICPRKTIAMVHDSAFLVYPHAYNFWGRQYLKWMNRLLIKLTKIIITPSEFSKSELVKFYRADAGKIVVAPPGYDENIYKKIDDSEKINQVLARLQISGPFIMSLGRLEEKKNTAGIVRAFNILKQDARNRSLKLVLAGLPGVGFEKVQSALAASPYKADIIVAGWVSAEDAACLLNAAAAFVFPSFYEGFGIPVLEAMACGCPCVLSDRGSLPEAGAAAALYVNPEGEEDIAAAVSRILTDNQLKTTLQHAGLERVKNFSWQQAAGRVWQCMKDLSERA